MEGCKRDLFFRDRDETFPDFPETRNETETFRDPDRDVFRDVANGTACQAFGFKLLQIMHYASHENNK